MGAAHTKLSLRGRVDRQRGTITEWQELAMSLGDRVDELRDLAEIQRLMVKELNEENEELRRRIARYEGRKG
ncbi:hypothetical protein [Thioalkalivibrio sp. ALE12]|uniref:hypothetical protein n=1 Tax=Thioalkalivibrio sp. ALE12 TaxID=1158170 RepID=UPI00035CBB89|nr:hypothetical protein [Thioalkalivibrio sp. ALE12]